MPLASLVATVFLVWAVIHAIFWLFRRSSSHSTLSTVPFSRATRTGRSFLGLNSYNTDLTLHNVHLRLSTTAWNEPHDRLAAFFLKKRNAKVRGTARAFYEAGRWIAVAGMIGGVAGLCWITIFGYKDAIWPVEDVGHVQQLHRRDGVGEVRSESSIGSAGMKTVVLIPILPGITVPLSDLPLIVLSVFISQVVHELGHAIAGALDSIPVISSGLSMVLVLPAAFVAFSTASIASLEPWAHARIIAAGPFHNLVLWAALALCRASGLDDFLTSFWYKDVSSVGRRLDSVQVDSPLYDHLVVGQTIITKLDDVSIAGVEDTWSKFLLSESKWPTEGGWCVDQSLIGLSKTCCGPAKGNATNACFLDFGSTERLGCLDSIPVLTNFEHPRCSASQGCPDGQVCGEFDQNLALLRISVKEGLESPSKVLLWSGPRHEIWEQVQTSRWGRRWLLLPVWFLKIIQTFRSYMEMAGLSLFFFNLVPIWHLDGRQLLECVVAGRRRPSAVIDPEAINERWPLAWRKQLPKIASVIVVTIVALNLIMQIYRLV